MRKWLALTVLTSALVAPATAAAPEDKECWGAKKAEVFHTTKECPAYKQIKPKNLVTFPSEDAAKKDGRKLCKKC